MPPDKPPFAKVLIANRGEIACRIMRTLRELGIVSVAIHHASEAAARHVRMADEAVQIAGETPVAAHLDGAADHRDRAPLRRGRDPSRLWLSLGKRRLRQRRWRSGTRLHRP